MKYTKGNLILMPLDKFMELRAKIPDQTYSLYPTWFDNKDVVNLTSHAAWGMSVKTIGNYLDSIIDSKDTIVWAILLFNDDKFRHIGNCSLQRIDLVHRSAEFAIIIGEPDAMGKGVGTFALHSCLEHGFKRLNLNRIWTGTSIPNHGMQVIAKKCGMTQEGLLREAMWINGKYENVIMYSILASEYNG